MTESKPGQDGGFEAAVRREFETLRPETATRGKEDRIQAILAAHDTALANVAREAIKAYIDGIPQARAIMS